MNIQQTNLIKMLRCVISAVPCDTLTSPDYDEITKLAQDHKLTGFLFASVPFLPKEQLPSPGTVAQWKTIYRSLLAIEANQQYEFERLLQALNQAEIKTLPVKGFAIAERYPQSVLRSMGDLDILYETDNADAFLALMKAMDYRAQSFGNGTTDQFFSETGLHVEMHRTLFENRMPEEAKYFIEHMFDFASAEEHPFLYSLSADDQYLYLLLHTYKHFIFAGTGIRSVLDIFLFRKQQLDCAYLDKKCKEFGIDEFRKELEHLSDVWFADAAPTSLSQSLADYIADGGVYGCEENKLHAQMIRANNGRGNGKLLYVLRRFFLPYRAMKIDYPVLKKLPVLLPFFWIYRAFRALFRRRTELSAEVQNLVTYDSRQADRVSELMQQLKIR